MARGLHFTVAMNANLLSPLAAVLVSFLAAGCASSEGAAQGPDVVFADAGTTGSDARAAESDAARETPRDGGSSADAAPVVHKRVFVTSQKYSGDVKFYGGGTNGAEGGDTVCSQLAAGAGLAGTFHAWLSIGGGKDVSDAVISRIAGTGPWYTTKDELVFASKTDLAKNPLVPIQYDENGQSASDTLVWTGTAPSGKQSGASCAYWNNADVKNIGSVGNSAAKDSTWTDNGLQACAARHPIYCFQD